VPWPHAAVRRSTQIQGIAGMPMERVQIACPPLLLVPWRLRQRQTAGTTQACTVNLVECYACHTVHCSACNLLHRAALLSTCAIRSETRSDLRKVHTCVTIEPSWVIFPSWKHSQSAHVAHLSGGPTAFSRLDRCELRTCPAGAAKSNPMRHHGCFIGSTGWDMASRALFWGQWCRGHYSCVVPRYPSMNLRY
jgi:hypothetical protein